MVEAVDRAETPTIEIESSGRMTPSLYPETVEKPSMSDIPPTMVARSFGSETNDPSTEPSSRPE